MTDSYKVGYSVDALDDLREIYSYIANELLVPETASAQLSRIRKEVRSLDFMPARYAFSNEYKKIHDVDEFDNNWYEYVEFGTTNPLTILLQRNGFSRESATFIKKHKNEYVVHDGSTDELRLRLSLLNCGNTSVMTEAASIRCNAPKLFLEEED